jgi:hypothetical protein
MDNQHQLEEEKQGGQDQEEGGQGQHQQPGGQGEEDTVSCAISMHERMPSSFYNLGISRWDCSKSVNKQLVTNNSLHENDQGGDNTTSSEKGTWIRGQQEVQELPCLLRGKERGVKEDDGRR